MCAKEERFFSLLILIRKDAHKKSNLMKRRKRRRNTQKKNEFRVTLNDVYSNSNTTFSNLIYKLEEETMLNELKQLIKASGRHTNVQKNIQRMKKSAKR